jgi:hypothetical protein
VSCLAEASALCLFAAASALLWARVRIFGPTFLAHVEDQQNVSQHCLQTYAKTGDELLNGAMFWSLMFLGLGIIEALTWFFSVRNELCILDHALFILGN